MTETDTCTPPKCEPPPPMTPQMSNIHNALMENIRFTKRQQWAITNYAVLIYAGLFGLARAFDKVQLAEKVIGTFLAFVTFVCATWLLILIQKDLGKYRTMLEKLHNKFLTEAERKHIGIEPYVNPALHGISFLVALIGVISVGALIVGYALLRSPNARDMVGTGAG